MLGLGAANGYVPGMSAKLTACVLLAGLAAGCDGSRPSDPPPPSPTNAASGTSRAITAPVDYVGAVGQAQKHSVKVLDNVQLREAIQQFHAGEDRYPRDLDELVKEGYLAKLPAPPTGMKFEYDPSAGQVKTVALQQP